MGDTIVKQRGQELVQYARELGYEVTNVDGKFFNITRPGAPREAFCIMVSDNQWALWSRTRKSDDCSSKGEGGRGFNTAKKVLEGLNV